MPKKVVMDETVRMWSAAAINGDIAALRECWDGGWVQNLELAEGSGWTALILASWYGHSDCVSTLLDWGAQIDASDSDSWTAYHHACFADHASCAALLVGKGCDVRRQNSAGATGRKLAQANNCKSVVAKLHALGVDQRDFSPEPDPKDNTREQRKSAGRQRPISTAKHTRKSQTGRKPKPPVDLAGRGQTQNRIASSDNRALKISSHVVSDSGRPKRALSAYMSFVIARRPRLLVERPDLASSVTDVARELGILWRGLPTAERAQFEEKSKLDKERFRREMTAYEARLAQVSNSLSNDDMGRDADRQSKTDSVSRGKRQHRENQSTGVPKTIAQVGADDSALVGTATNRDRNGESQHLAAQDVQQRIQQATERIHQRQLALQQLARNSTVGNVIEKNATEQAASTVQPRRSSKRIRAARTDET